MPCRYKTSPNFLSSNLLSHLGSHQSRNKRQPVACPNSSTATQTAVGCYFLLTCLLCFKQERFSFSNWGLCLDLQAKPRWGDSWCFNKGISKLPTLRSLFISFWASHVQRTIVDGHLCAWATPGNNSVFHLDQVFYWVFCVDLRHLAKIMVAVIRLLQLPSKGPFNGWSCSYQKLGLRVVVDDVEGNHSILKQRRTYCTTTSGRCRAFFLTFFYLFLKCVRVLSLK